MKIKLVTCLVFGLMAVTGNSPAQVPDVWVPRGMGGGGAVYAPSISPHNPDEAWLSCDMSVVSQTLDFGNTWRTVSFDTLSGQRNSKVNFTNHPDTLYVEALDLYTAKNYPRRSSDGGKTWQVVPSESYWGNYGSFRLFSNPGNAKQLVASGFSSVCYSSDYGNTFVVIHTAATQGSTFIHLAGVLFKDDSIFISTDRGMIISPDNGSSWEPYVSYATMGIPQGTGGEAVVSFAGAGNNNHTLFYCTTIASANLTNRTEPRDIQYFKKLYRMNRNGSPAWSDITAGLKNAGQVFNDYNYAYQVTLNPGNPDTMYLTGQTRSPATAGGARFGTVFRTTDGGETFTNVFLQNNNPANAGMTTGWVGAAAFSPWEHTWNSINTTEGLCVDPHNVNRLMRSDFSLVCVSGDGGNTWDQRYVAVGEHPASTLINRQDLYETNGLQTTVCHWVHWMSSSRVLLAYSDLLLNESNDGGITWGFLYDSLWSAKVNDIQMLCVSPQGRMYAPEGEILGNNGDWSDYRLALANAGRIMYSDDAVHWHLLKNFGTPVSWASFDPSDASTMYVAVVSPLSGADGGIWKCSGLPASPAWTLLPAPPRTEKRPTQVFVLNDGDLVAVYGARDSSTAQPVSYSFTASSGVFISHDRGNTWSDLCAGYPGMQKDSRFLTIDPADPGQDNWFLGVGSSGAGSEAGLYRTTDRGATWTNVWPGVTVLGTTMHPLNTSEMYVCTASDGLFYATDANTNAPLVNPVSTYPFKAPERVFFNPYDASEVWVASWGNGLRIGTSASVGTLPSHDDPVVMRVFPNPSSGTLTIIPGMQGWSFRLIDALGRTVYQSASAIGGQSFRIDGLAPGIYCYQSKENEKMVTGKVIIQ